MAPLHENQTIMNKDNQGNQSTEATVATIRKSLVDAPEDGCLLSTHQTRTSRSLSPRRNRVGSPTKGVKNTPDGKVNNCVRFKPDTNGFVQSQGRVSSPNFSSPRPEQERQRRRTNSTSDSRQGREARKATTPKKIEFQRRTPREDCFSAPVDSFLGEFDFEKNLALFDKQAVFEEINHHGNPYIIQSAVKKPTKYKHDENVLKSGPVTVKQINTGSTDGGEFVTDSGLLVPRISYETRCELFSAAERYGFSTDRVLEMVGRSAAEMVMQLLGGSHRLNPANAHQKPTVAVLCGPHMAGAQAVNTARQLAIREINVLLFVRSFVKMLPALEQEIKLFEYTEGSRISQVKDLPQTPVDFIINALDGHESKILAHQDWYNSVVKWANDNKAQVLGLDPPEEGGVINNKWSLSLCLPLNLNDKCGQVYLADLGFPKKVFQENGISYKSPFGHKFVIPLHAKR